MNRRWSFSGRCLFLLALALPTLLVLSPADSSGQSAAFRAQDGNDSRQHENSGEADRQAGDHNWVLIPGGTFQMGSDVADLFGWEKPVHTVKVSAFEMARTETTVGQYRKCVEAGACTAPGTAGTCNWGKSDREDHPINCIDWEQASAYAKWVGGRLPTEAEWEYAARSGGRDQKYPWGDQAVNCSYAVFYDGNGPGCGHESTWPVCSKTAGNTKQGLCDMSGNVWEWTQDRWHDNYTGAPSDGSAWEESGSGRVARGGSWYINAKGVRATYRYRFASAASYYFLGLRPARDVP